MRIGIGKPPSKERGADHVLSRLPKAERELLDVAIVRAADAVEVLLAEGPGDAPVQRRLTAQFNVSSAGTLNCRHVACLASSSPA